MTSPFRLGSLLGATAPGAGSGEQPAPPPPAPPPATSPTGLSAVLRGVSGLGSPFGSLGGAGATSAPPFGSPFDREGRSGLGGLLTGGLGGTQPAEPAPPPGVAQPAPPPPDPALGVRAGIGTISAIDPSVLAGIRIPPDLIIPPRVEPVPQRQTLTQLAQQAIAQLRAAEREPLLEAIRTLQAKSLPGADVVNLLERRTRIGEVLSQPAERWAAETVNDFATAFQMNAQRTGVMNLVTAIGILNDRELEAELRLENMPAITPNELLQNRRIVYQYPPPGTELQPPYVILVAVEHQDLRRADEAVNAIIGQLVDFQGYRLPRDAAARIS